MARLAISVLGSFQVMLDGVPVTTFETDKARALLAYLAVEAGRPHRREGLGALLWPERPESAARNNLRQTLFRLRNSIADQGADPPYLTVTSQDVQFNLHSDCCLDVIEFGTRLEACWRHHPQEGSLCQACLQSLQAAVDLYQGDFLSGFSLPDCPQFEWWLLTQQEAYHRQALETLTLLGSHYELNQEYAQASRFVEGAIELEPWREVTHRQMMRVLALGGQRSAALRQYQECRRILKRELGIEPSSESVRLFKRIRDGRLDTGALKDKVRGPTVVEPLTSGVPGTFVAREEELAKLEYSLAAALAGQGRVVFVTGEAGSGKTSLIGEFTRRSLQAHEGLLAAGGSCNAYAGWGNAYLPFVECLRMLSGDVDASQVSCLFSEELIQRQWASFPAVLQAVLEAGPDLVGTLLPGQALVQYARAAAGLDDSWLDQLETLLAGTPEDQPLDSLGEQPAAGEERLVQAGAGSVPLNQAELFDQVTQVLQTLSRRYAVILVLDDLQWADQASLNLLFHLGRRLTGSRILVICAYRPEDVALGREGARHPLEPVVNELQALFGEQPVDLSKADGRSFVGALVDSEPNVLGPGFRQTLTHHTGGHPLFTVDLLRGLQERGDLVKDGQGRWATEAELNWEALPTRVEAVIAERLGRLAPDSKALLGAASVQGETFTAEVLARAVGMDVAQVGRRLSGELGRQHRLVRALGRRRLSSQSLSQYCFRHFLYQLYLYQDLDEVERARLHQVTGEALETISEIQSGEPAIAQASPVNLAWHFEQAGIKEKAIGYLRKAGTQSYMLAANDEAIAHYSRALQLVESLPQTPEGARQELEIQLFLGAPLVSLKGYAATELGQLFTHAYDLALQTGDRELIFTAQFLLNMFYFFKADYGKSLELGTDLSSIAEEAQNELLVQHGCLSLGVTRLYLGDSTAAQGYLEKVIAISVPPERNLLSSLMGETSLLAGLVFQSHALWLLGYPTQSLKRCLEARALVQGLEYPYSLAIVLGYGVCMQHLLRREYHLVQAYGEELLELSKEKGFGMFQAWGMIFLGRAQVEHGEVEAGLANLRQGLAEYQSTGQKMSLSFLLLILAEAYVESGQVEKGLEAVEHALVFIEETGERFAEAEVLRVKGELLAHKQDQTVGNGEVGENYQQVEECFRRAIEVSRKQQAKSWELRAVISLAGLLRIQSREAEAIARLEEITAWFTEGVDTPDMKEAQTLLDSLR